MMGFKTLVMAAVTMPVLGQFCELLDVHKDGLTYPDDLDEPDALGCFKYATIDNSDKFFKDGKLTVVWEVHHTGANELHFGLSEGPATKPSDKEGNTKAFRGAVYRTTGDGIGLHSLTYGYPSGHGDKSVTIRKTGQRFYELLMYPSGGVTIRRVSCDSNSGEYDRDSEGAACQRWGGGISGSFRPGYTYNSNNNPHKFWMTYVEKTGEYLFGSGEDVGKNQILKFVDPKPIPVRYISANVYCCNVEQCAQRRNDDNGYFCFCDSKDGGWCTGPPPPTTTITTTTATTTTTTTTTTSATTVTTTTATKTSTTVTTSRKCGAGEFRNAQSNACKSCPAGTYMSRVSHTATRCFVQAACGVDEYTKTAGTATSMTVCATTQECADGQYESKPHAPGQDERECSAITKCVDGEYVKRAATSTTNTVCSPCDGSVASYVGGVCTTTTATVTTTTASTTTITDTTTTMSTTTITTTTATVTYTTTTVTDTTTTGTTTTTVLATPADDSMVAITEADLQNAEADYEAASNQVESVESQLAAALKDANLQVETIESADDLEDLLTGANVDPDEIMFLKDAYINAAKNMADAEAAVADAQAAYASAISPAKASNTTVIVVVIVALLIIVAVLGVAYTMKNNGQSGDGTAVAFENPMYDQVHNAGGGEQAFVDTNQKQQQQQSNGYMDVSGSGGQGQQQSSGYMDVSARPTASANDNFDDGISTDDEEV